MAVKKRSLARHGDACNLSTGEAEAGGSPTLRPCLQNKQTNKQKTIKKRSLFFRDTD
jgi:hypothetical protein